MMYRRQRMYLGQKYMSCVLPKIRAARKVAKHGYDLEFTAVGNRYVIIAFQVSELL